MKKKVLFAAMALVALASCSTDEMIEVTTPQDNSPTSESDAIVFASASKGITRADIYGSAAADLLGNIFYVTGTKGTEANYYPTPDIVFDNYLVHYDVNTAGTTTSNTSNWEYVGVTPEAGIYTDYVKLSSLNRQTIKYWDYSAAQYDFFAFSTGKDMKAVAFNAVNQSNPAANEIGVTAMQYGDQLDVETSVPVAYKFFIPSVAAIGKTFITDITEVAPANYGKEVMLKFKNLGSKVRVALYETIPGYSVKDVVFYTEDGEDDFAVSKGDDAALISASGLPTRGTIEVQFKHVGSENDGESDYDKASTIVSPIAANSVSYMEFGKLTAQLTDADEDEENDNLYLGRSLPEATFAGSSAASFYQTVFPVSGSSPLTLRVNYTLVSTDGSGEEIDIYGAKAVVPSTYTVWQPNYAYTYIFKITDNTNGWTDPSATYPAGLFPITFDAVVAEATDANAEQTTITTVAVPTITTYQQGHNPKADGSFGVANEYDNDGKKLYVQVMDNNHTPAKLVGTGSSTLYKLNTQTGDATPTDRSLLYYVSDANATEAKVMDALEKRTTVLSDADVKGRNSVTLTKQASPSIINNAVTSIVNGVDDNPITVAAGEAAEIAIQSLTSGTYAYVYDYTAAPKTTVTEYQPIVPGTEYIENSSSTKTFYTVTVSELNGITPEASAVSSSSAGFNDYLYFSKTTNGSNVTTYSYISVADKTTLPAGVVKIAKTTVASHTAVGNSIPAANTFYFDVYITNTGRYAVKIIKVVD